MKVTINGPYTSVFFVPSTINGQKRGFFLAQAPGELSAGHVVRQCLICGNLFALGGKVLPCSNLEEAEERGCQVRRTFCAHAMAAA